MIAQMQENDWLHHGDLSETVHIKYITIGGTMHLLSLFATCHKT